MTENLHHRVTASSEIYHLNLIEPSSNSIRYTWQMGNLVQISSKSQDISPGFYFRGRCLSDCYPAIVPTLRLLMSRIQVRHSSMVPPYDRRSILTNRTSFNCHSRLPLSRPYDAERLLYSGDCYDFSPLYII